jgi:hypothetical protein
VMPWSDERLVIAQTARGHVLADLLRLTTPPPAAPQTGSTPLLLDSAQPPDLSRSAEPQEEA